MRRTRDVLNYAVGRGLSIRQTAAITGVNRTTVAEYLERFEKSDLSWPLPTDIDDLSLEKKLFPGWARMRGGSDPTAIDFDYIHVEMKLPGASLAVLHAEWCEQSPDRPIGYSQFCKRYKAYKRSLRISMRRTDPHGEVAYVDYSGKTIDITDPNSGEIRRAQVFVGVLGGSSYTYCEASWTQRSRDWIASHVRMLEFFGGAPRVLVPDNLKAAVTKADRFSPVINETYHAMCRYYGVVPVPARAGRPKDKARGEGAVCLAQRWILFVLRKHKFFSLEEANRKIRDLLTKLNNRSFQKKAGSRFSLWLEHERPVLLPLPVEPYEIAEWGKVRAGVDYHVEVDKHHYSVPYQQRDKEFEYRLTEQIVELIFKGQSVVAHRRSYESGKTTTLPEHQPPAHKAVQQWSAEEALVWAADIGPSTRKMLELRLSNLAGSYMGYRMTQSIKSLVKSHGNARLEEACTYALAHKITSIPELRTILAKRLDQLFSDDMPIAPVPCNEHENIRGPGYYSRLLTPVEEVEKHEQHHH